MHPPPTTHSLKTPLGEIIEMELHANGRAERGKFAIFPFFASEIYIIRKIYNKYLTVFYYKIREKGLYLLQYNDYCLVAHARDVLTR